MSGGTTGVARTWAATAVAAGVGALVWLSLFSVDTAEFAIVTEFGNPVQVITEPGLRVKLPYQNVNRFDNRVFIHTPPLNEFLTKEKTAVVASTAVLWRIADPRKYFETVFNRLGAESRLSDILFAELGAAIGSNPLTAFLSTVPDEYRAEAILTDVAEKCRQIALRDFGIAVLDVKLQRLDFPKRNRLSVYSRMKSERVRISMKYRSEGEEESLKIRAAANQEKARIMAEAFKVAQQHRGEGEAEAARIYARSLGSAPEFYWFVRTMEATRKALEKETTLVLPADSELFGLLFDSNHFGDDAPVAAEPVNETEEVPTD